MLTLSGGAVPGARPTSVSTWRLALQDPSHPTASLICVNFRYRASEHDFEKSGAGQFEQPGLVTGGDGGGLPWSGWARCSVRWRGGDGG